MSAVANPVVRRTVDGGLSGTLTVSVGPTIGGAPASLVVVESDLLDATLVLSMSEAEELGYAVTAAVFEAKHLLHD